MLPHIPPQKKKKILFELDFNVKFPLLRLLQFLSDLKSIILFMVDNASMVLSLVDFKIKASRFL